MTKRELAERISDMLADAFQSDCEHGIKWLNERAAASYLAEYPATARAVFAIKDLVDGIADEVSP